MRTYFGKLGEDFLHNMPIYKNLFQFSHRCYGLAETKSVVQASFHVCKGLFQPSTSKNCFGQMRFNLTKLTEVLFLTGLCSKTSFIFYTVITGWENLKYLYRSFFQKYTILLCESSTSKEYFEEIEIIMEK